MISETDEGTSEARFQRRLPPALIAVSPGTLADAAATPGFVERVRAAVRGGVRGVLLREAQLEDLDYLELARELRGVLGPPESGGWLCVHDRLHLVKAAGADAGYAAGRSLPPAEARRVVGPGVALGAAVHAGDPDPEEADFVCFAPVFAPHSKELAPGTRPAGLDGLMDRLAVTRTPTWAMGGLDAERIAALTPPVRGAAVIGALWGHPERPADATAVESHARSLTRAAAEALP